MKLNKILILFISVVCIVVSLILIPRAVELYMYKKYIFASYDQEDLLLRDNNRADDFSGFVDYCNELKIDRFVISRLNVFEDGSCIYFDEVYSLKTSNEIVNALFAYINDDPSGIVSPFHNVTILVNGNGFIEYHFDSNTGLIDVYISSGMIPESTDGCVVDNVQTVYAYFSIDESNIAVLESVFPNATIEVDTER